MLVHTCTKCEKLPNPKVQSKTTHTNTKEKKILVPGFSPEPFQPGASNPSSGHGGSYEDFSRKDSDNLHINVKRIHGRDEKSRIRETPTLSTDADSRTDTNLKRLRDLSLKKKMRKCVIYLQKSRKKIRKK